MRCAVEGFEGEFRLIQPNPSRPTPKRHKHHVGDVFELVCTSLFKITLYKITEKGNYFLYSEGRKAMNKDVVKTAEPVDTYKPGFHHLLLVTTLQEALEQGLINQALYDRLVSEEFEAFQFNLNTWTYAIRKLAGKDSKISRKR